MCCAKAGAVSESLFKGPTLRACSVGLTVWADENSKASTLPVMFSEQSLMSFIYNFAPPPPLPLIRGRLKQVPSLMCLSVSIACL